MALRLRLGAGAPLRYRASASLTIGEAEHAREWSARARLEVVASDDVRPGLLRLDLRLLELATADERGSVELRDGRARVSLAGALGREADGSDVLAMRELDELASVLGADLSLRAAVRASSRGDRLELDAEPSPAGLVSFASLLVPELPATPVRTEETWRGVVRATPLDPDARCRARQRVIRLTSDRAYLRWDCDELVVHGVACRAEGAATLDLGRGALVDLDARVRSRAGAPAAVEASYGAQLDE